MRTKYQADFPERARKLAKAGMLDKEISKSLGITEASFYKYQNEHADFMEAIKEGKAKPNEDVEASLYKLAMGGFETQEVIAVPMGPGEDAKARVVRIVKKTQPPNVVAQIFWLKNRVKDRWRDVRQIDAHVQTGVPQVPDDMSDEDLDVVTSNLKRLMPDLFNGKSHAGRN
jgi:hypothetical protein